MFFLWDNWAASLFRYWVAAKATHFFVLRRLLHENQTYRLGARSRYGFLRSRPAGCVCGSCPGHAHHGGFLPQTHAIGWSVVCLPFLVWGFITIRKLVTCHRKTILLLAMMGAYAFVLSALKMPSVTGSSSHPTGTGLGAVLFGPAPMALLGLLVLLFQAILLAHGGLTTLGANTFSMAIAGPIVSYGIFKLCRKLNVNRLVAVGLAAGIGDLFTYCVTAGQLALAHPGEAGVMASLGEFLGIFAVTQISLAIVEGIIAAIVMMMLESFAKPELREIGYLAKEGN